MNKKISKWCINLPLILLLPVLLVSAQSHDDRVPDASKPPCSDCHVCQVPTETNPCLEMCVRMGAQPAEAHSAAEGPEVTVIDELAQLYAPVDFNHKLHAEMVGMGEGCSVCHHYSPPGKFPSCSECHSDHPSEPQSLRQPGLKGAYHRQCMGCHREWSHDTKCIFCHLPANGIDFSVAPIDSTDILGISHPVITEPEKKVWTTPYSEGPVVTFHHQEHIDLFELRCVDCHQGENCSYCHDLEKEARLGKTDAEIHAICNDCHGEDPCATCHDTREKPAFTHAANGGWELNRFHKGLSCRACHPTGRKIGKLSGRCSDCHGGWNQENFRHAVTGLQLDEIHIELDCGDCHIDLIYGNTPDCSGCHDDGRTHEDAPPGHEVQASS
ncbi:MAG: hypothetical protein JSU74_01315 [Candidatus Zixiibacteriota bacterium]|nr:MAG: hypothetical protein JSU74_01315 [candidate division Zixibacteria bacterium]